MLVEAQVSSMNTRRAGSRSNWPSNQASRRFTMSGRSCSAACAVFFFARDLVTAKEAPQRPVARRNAPRGERRPKLFKSDVRGLIDQRANGARMTVHAHRAPVAPTAFGVA